MTLCELATANHSPPLECVSLTADTELAGYSYKPLPLNSCVEYVYRFYAAYMRLVGPDSASELLGPCRGVPSTGPAILGTFEKSVSILRAPRCPLPLIE